MPNSYPEWRNFQFALHNHYGFFLLHALPSTIKCVLCYQIYAEITTFFDQELFRLVPIQDIDVENFGWKLTSAWREDIKDNLKVVILMPCMRVILHPSYKTLPSPGGVHGNSGRVCKLKFPCQCQIRKSSCWVCKKFFFLIPIISSFYSTVPESWVNYTWFIFFSIFSNAHIIIII